jgi:hypothetical protein
MKTFLSNLIKHVIFSRKMPEKEDAHLTLATRLLEKRREMAEVESSLTAEKEVRFQKFSTFQVQILF